MLGNGARRRPEDLELARLEALIETDVAAWELGRLRNADQDDSQTARLVEALLAIRATQTAEPVELAPEVLRAALAGRPGWEWVTTTKRLAGLLHPRGLFKSRPRSGSKRPYVKGEPPSCRAATFARHPAAASQEVPPPDPAEVARGLGLPLARLDRMVEVEIRMGWCPVPPLVRPR